MEGSKNSRSNPYKNPMSTTTVMSTTMYPNWVGGQISIPSTSNVISFGSGYASTYSTNIAWEMVNFKSLINDLFTEEEMLEWLKENGYTENQKEEFYEVMKIRFKGYLLAPKQVLKVKLPKVD